jgi:serralysin
MAEPATTLWKAGFGDDTLFGDADNDTISGKGNSDFIIGGLGKDSLTGGEGDDFFSFTSAKDSIKGANHDVIEDFDILIGEHDQIDLRSIDAKKGHGNQAFHFIGAAKFHHKAGELHVLDKGVGGFRVEGDTNGDGKADFQIEVHSGELLAKGDFPL